MAIEPNFLPVFGDYFLAAYRFPGSSFQRDGGIRIELTRALAADHQITIACGAQPLNIGLCSNAGINHHQGALRRIQILQQGFRVPASLTLPAKVCERRTKPLPSRTKPSVTSGQSGRFSFERPRRAFVLCGTSPSK